VVRGFQDEIGHTDKKLEAEQIELSTPATSLLEAYTLTF
jgi:hypothetical protein